ncbi:MAG: hypothetical protein LBK26_02245 [Rickettsiales bacterium]|jgi:hypothetical protein|nr:hypothetical protein [Rickettsiales bacterium]
MKEDEQMFQWGVGLFAAVFVLIAALQVCYRVQDRARTRVRNEIVKTQQEYAETQAKFSALIRPENLRSIVAEMFPKFEPIGFKKNITAGEIKVIGNQ